MPTINRRRSLWGLLAVILIVVAGGGLYLGRHKIKDAWAAFRAPKLPPASVYVPGSGAPVASGQDVTSPFEPGYSTSEHYTLETSPGTKPVAKDPLAFKGTLPAETNLAVPFTTQAPFTNWDFPYQEACEEASAIMVNAYYDGKTGRIPAADADKEILDIVAYEKATLGFYEDTNAAQTAQFIKGFYGYDNVIVKPLGSADDIKQAVALGYPVIIPFSGKALGNPNFRNGGPPYHMLVVRGYTPTLFITNDPGTRNGEQYTYTYDRILSAAHEWVGDAASINNGKKMMIVVIPNATK
ncbi:MAG: C39 family peptidase [Patescibacteria group bacterium]